MTKRTDPKPPCAEPGCERTSRTRGVCDKHYRQRRRHGGDTPPPATRDLPGERWRPVVGYEDSYEVSDLGRVRSVDRTITDALGRTRRLRSRVLELVPCSKAGHLTAQLGLGASNKRLVHRLVLESFVGPCPPGTEGCHHPDPDPANNRLANLRWDTRSANHLDMQRHGTDVYRNRERCPRKHLLAMPNLCVSAWEKRRHRSCLACERARNMARYYAENGGRPYDLDAAADRYYEEIMKSA